MTDDIVTTIDLRSECYVLQVDGEVKSKHGRFLDALKTALQLKQMAPLSDVKVLERGSR